MRAPKTIAGVRGEQPMSKLFRKLLWSQTRMPKIKFWKWSFYYMSELKERLWGPCLWVVLEGKDRMWSIHSEQTTFDGPGTRWKTPVEKPGIGEGPWKEVFWSRWFCLVMEIKRRKWLLKMVQTNTVHSCCTVDIPQKTENPLNLSNVALLYWILAQSAIFALIMRTLKLSGLLSKGKTWPCLCRQENVTILEMTSKSALGVCRTDSPILKRGTQTWD